jgi:hypothetical protein
MHQQRAESDRAVHLRAVRFHAALALSRTTQLAATSNGTALELHSRSEDATTWTLHASAVVDQGPTIPKGRSLSERADVSRREVDVTAAYDNLSARGLQYGPAFRTMRALHVGADDVLVSLRAEDPARALTDSLSLSPVLLDGAFQALIALLDDEPTATLLPIEIDRVSLLRPAGASVVAHGRLVERSGDSFVADLELFTEDGELVAALVGLRCKRVASPTRAGAADVLTTRWVGLDADASSWMARGGWAVYGDGALARSARSALRSVSAAVDEAGAIVEGQQVIAPVAHQVVCVEEPRDLFASVRALGALASRLARGGWVALTVCTRGAVAARAEESCSPMLRAVWGAMRSAARELPSLRVRLVDIATGASDRAIVTALAASDEDELAVRGDEVLSARLVKGLPEASAAKADPVRQVIRWDHEAPATCRSDASAIDTPVQLVVERVLTLLDVDPSSCVRLAFAREPSKGRWAIVATDAIESVLDRGERSVVWCEAEPSPAAVARSVLRRLLRSLGVSAGCAVWLGEGFESWRSALEELGVRCSSDGATAAAMLCSSVSEAEQFASLCLREAGVVVLFGERAKGPLDLSRLPEHASIRRFDLRSWIARELTSITSERDGDMATLACEQLAARSEARGLRVSVVPRGEIEVRDRRRVRGC